MTIRRTASLGVLITIAISSLVYIIKPNTSSQVVEAATSHTLTFSGEPTDRTPELYRGSFFTSTLSDMLANLQVRTYPEDKVFTFPEPALGVGSQIKVYRAQPVLIKDGDSEVLVRTWAPTIAEVLKEQSVEVGDKDAVEPALSSSATVQESPIVITVTRVSVQEVIKTEKIAYDTQYKDDADLEKGSQKVDQSGVHGVRTNSFLIRRENGVEISRILIDHAVTTEPVTEVIKRGTKVTQLGRGGASWYGGVPALTAAHRTLPMGTKVKVVNVATGASVVVTIADRGPFVEGRVIDLSKDAFSQIASLGSGVAQVHLEKAQ